MPPRADLYSRLPRWVWPIASVVLALIVLQLAVSVGVLSAKYFPTVPQLLAALAHEVVAAAFWTAVGQTLEATLLGLLIAVVIGVAAGMLLGANQYVWRASKFVVEFLRPIPSVALIPLVILVYGTGLQASLFLVAFGALWPVLLQTIYGVHDVDSLAVDTARSYGIGRLRRLGVVTLPSAVPFVATGVRLGMTVALLLAVTAETVIGAPGLGQAINQAESGNAISRMYALIVATGVLGVVVNTVLAQAERQWVRWVPSARRARSS